MSKLRSLAIASLFFMYLPVYGQVSFNCQDVQQNGLQYVIPCNVSGAFSGTIGWASVSNIFVITSQSSTMSFNLLEGNQRLPAQCDGSPSNPCQPSVTPMVVDIYKAVGGNFVLVYSHSLSASQSFSTAALPLGTEARIVTSGQILDVRNQCFFFCSWQVVITLHP